MKKLVVKLDLHDDRDKQKALKTVSTLRGIDSIAMDMKERKLTIIGTVDPVNVVSKLRKYWQTDLVSVGPAKEEKKEEPKKEEPKKEDASKEEPKKEEGGKEEPKKEEGGGKEETKKDGESKPEEGKKDDDKKDDSKKEETKKEEQLKKPPLALPPPQQFNPYMMDYFAKGYRPPFNPYMNPGPYNPYMNNYNPYMATHNPYMVTHNPPVATHYYVQSAEENPSGCTIC